MPASSQISPQYVADLEERLASAEAANATLAEANARLERLLLQSRHARFGPSSEKGDPDQRNLFAEDIEVAEGQLAAAGEAADKALGTRLPQTGTKGGCRSIWNVSKRSSNLTALCAPAAAACTGSARIPPSG